MTLESKFKDEIGIEAYDKTLGTYSIRYVDWLENKLREQLTIHSVVKSLPDGDDLWCKASEMSRDNFTDWYDNL